MEVLGKRLKKAVSDSVSYVCTSSHTLSSMNILNRSGRKGSNCSEHR